MRNCLIFLVIISAILSSGAGFGQTPVLPVISSPVLDEYIQLGLAHNLGLQQQALAHEKSRLGVMEARALLWPAITVSSRYTRADGGRAIEFPIGDLMNPVYGALNSLLPTPQFPAAIPNEKIRIIPEEEHDTKVSLVQPIFNGSIYHHYQAQKHREKMSRAEQQQRQREIVADIKIAYFTYLKISRVAALYDQTLELMAENKRVTGKLFTADKVTRDVVYRSETAYQHVAQQLETARNEQLLAGNYLNFLLNRPFSTPIAIDSVTEDSVRLEISLGDCQQAALENRPELVQLSAAINAVRAGQGAAASAFLPTMALAADFGFTEEDGYRFDAESDYWMVSGVLEWNVFRGLGDKMRLDQARLDERRLVLVRQELEQQIRLEVERAYHNLETARRLHDVARLAVKSADENFRMVQKRYEQGMASIIEFLDAETSYTTAHNQAIVAQYEIFIALTHLERALSLFPLE